MSTPSRLIVYIYYSTYFLFFFCLLLFSLYPSFAPFFFFFNDTATTEIYTLSLHDALPIFERGLARLEAKRPTLRGNDDAHRLQAALVVLDPATGQIRALVGGRSYQASQFNRAIDRKSTRLNSSHDQISYAVFCLKKKKKHVIVRSERIYTRLHSRHDQIRYCLLFFDIKFTCVNATSADKRELRATKIDDSGDTLRAPHQSTHSACKHAHYLYTPPIRFSAHTLFYPSFLSWFLKTSTFPFYLF